MQTTVHIYVVIAGKSVSLEWFNPWTTDSLKVDRVHGVHFDPQ